MPEANTLAMLLKVFYSAIAATMENESKRIVDYEKHFTIRLKKPPAYEGGMIS